MPTAPKLTQIAQLTPPDQHADACSFTFSSEDQPSNPRQTWQIFLGADWQNSHTNWPLKDPHLSHHLAKNIPGSGACAKGQRPFQQCRGAQPHI